jgi:hypothetical protein
MTEQKLDTGDQLEEKNNPVSGSFVDFEKESKLDTLGWYLVVFGFISLGLAGLCLYLQRIKYRDFTINGNVLGNYLLMFGIFLYVAGRAIKYYQRYQRRKAG